MQISESINTSNNAESIFSWRVFCAVCCNALQSYHDTLYAPYAVICMNDNIPQHRQHYLFGVCFVQCVAACCSVLQSYCCSVALYALVWINNNIQKHQKHQSNNKHPFSIRTTQIFSRHQIFSQHQTTQKIPTIQKSWQYRTTQKFRRQQTPQSWHTAQQHSKIWLPMMMTAFIT